MSGYRDEYDSDDDDNEFMGRYDFPRYGVMSEIIPDKLYLGDHTIANDLQVLQIHKIVRVISLGGMKEQTEYETHDGIEYHWIYLDDHMSEPISKYFDAALEFIHKSPGPVFVHCWAGISRSSTIVIAYLMKYRGLGYPEALVHVKQRRGFICPNIGFQGQLLEFHDKLATERAAKK